MQQQYTTVMGDTWDIIAKKTLGKEAYVNQLIDVNLEYSRQYYFSAGVVLNIPEVVKPSTANLPPWRK